MKQSIISWFNPYNDEHLAAYYRFMKTGRFGDSLPEGVYLQAGWENYVDKACPQNIEAILTKKGYCLECIEKINTCEGNCCKQ